MSVFVLARYNRTWAKSCYQCWFGAVLSAEIELKSEAIKGLGWLWGLVLQWFEVFSLLGIGVPVSAKLFGEYASGFLHKVVPIPGNINT